MGPGLFLAICGLAGTIGGLRPIRATGLGWRDAGLLAALVPVALFSIRPYVGGNLVGGGDSQHYALQVADFVTQSRQGVLPVLVGQSDYAFNGNIHTLRTAPYFTHFAGLLDWLTFHRLSFVVLQNLTVTATAVLAAWAAYAAVWVLSGRRRILAGLLAALYVLSPAIAGPLARQDMFATYMAAPWLVLAWAGIALVLREPGNLRAHLLAAGAVGLTWYAHSPLGAWLSLAWGLAQAWLLLRAGGTLGQWQRQAAGWLLLVVLAAAFAASVATLGPGPVSSASPNTFAYTRELLQSFLRTEFTPLRLDATQAGIQLGWGLWLVALVALALAIRQRHPAPVVLAGLFLPFLVPLPGLTKLWWHLLPQTLVEQTVWPAQRLCPLLAAGFILALAATSRDLPARASRWLGGLLAAALAWSAAESLPLLAHHRRVRHDAAVQATLLTPENLRLTRYSYALFERPPAYFTHGWADPEFESRLLDADQRPLADNGTAAVAAAPAAPMTLIERETNLALSGPGLHVLVFAFADPAASGEIVVHGPGFRRAYTLPASGEPLAFGAGPGAGKTLPLRLPAAGLHTITIASSAPGVSVRAVSVEPESQPVRLSGLIPYTAQVLAPAPGYLETPRMYLAGYAATVDGRPAPVQRSPQGLVMVPVPAGRSAVTVTYPGPLSLRMTWFLSLAALAGWPWLLGTGGRRAQTPARSLPAGLAQAWRAHPRACLLALAALAGLGLLGAGIREWRLISENSGDLHLVVEFPLNPPSRAEPLVTIGQAGAADCIYVIYEDADHIRIGFDHWGYGGPVSAPLPLQRGRPQRLEISLGSLQVPTRWFGLRRAPLDRQARTGPLRLVLDGQAVFTRDQAYYPSPPEEVVLGANPAGSSVAVERFSGKILSAERRTAPAR